MLNHNQEDLFAQYLITAVNKRDNNSMISHNTYVHYMYHIIIQLKQQMWVKYNLAGGGGSRDRPLVGVTTITSSWLTKQVPDD